MALPIISQMWPRFPIFKKDWKGPIELSQWEITGDSGQHTLIGLGVQGVGPDCSPRSSKWEVEMEVQAKKWGSDIQGRNWGVARGGLGSREGYDLLKMGIVWGEGACREGEGEVTKWLRDGMRFESRLDMMESRTQLVVGALPEVPPLQGLERRE